MATELNARKRPARKTARKFSLNTENELKARIRQIGLIMKKSIDDRTDIEQSIMKESPDIVEEIERRARYRDERLKKLEEVEDPPAELLAKVALLAEAIKHAKHVVLYTGAGISTAASIPDYRGPNGVWTLLQKGKPLEKTNSLVDAEPTLTHMAISTLHKVNHVKHVVSQNCDGLHLRSGLPRSALSEVHGNMYIEVCTECDREYIRLFDVTEKSSFRRHTTDRYCTECNSPLRDSIVHFGEKGNLEQPLNWEEAAEAAKQADLILCLGSSLKILRKYPCLWGMHRMPHKRPKLYIINLQWTPKDDLSTLKINGKCDDVMKLVMEKLGLEIPQYKRDGDPIFELATPVPVDELQTMMTKHLVRIFPHSNIDMKPVLNENGKMVKIEPEVYKTVPGWFGKGCAKRISKKRKRLKSA
ncbi:NAD-dependent protein deacetylase sirtuin-7-like [Saccoglossus kowalevskii]|uniref:Regulatory protein SIR2 homolog 7 n=1 Tax=Saccoglossus kowalevskii TaxID=10224 RepID=A0ABM0LVI8_SACKO|nr:PREDICTED: NAD-dependent protein deacetylase sirtuin-7-like [Saccoglossus kowalevskii]